MILGLTPYQLIKRLVLFALALFFAWQSFLGAAANVARDKRPDAALKLLPSDAGALAIRNDLNLTRDEATGKWEINPRDSIASYKSDGLNARAVRQLGFIADNSGNKTKAKALIEMSQKMTRRDFGAQLWLINQSAQLGDIPTALRHIDISLRTSPESHALLFPILTNALTDSQFQTSFTPLIKTSPPWLPAFLDHTFGKNVHLDVISRSIILAGGLPKSKDRNRLNQLILTQLVSNRYYSEAENYFAATKSPIVGILTDAALTPASIDSENGPMAWQTFQTSDFNGTIEPSSRNGTYQLNLTTGSGQRRVAAQKLLYLPPGNYDLSAKYSFLAGGKDSSVHWTLSCQQKGPLASESTVGVIKNVDGVQKLVLMVPRNCPVQYLKLMIVGGRDTNDTNVIVDELSIKPPQT
jgi:hypothetical protein